MDTDLVTKLRDPLKLAKLLWPEVVFYKEQREIIYSVRDNDETFVPAGNMLGVAPPLTSLINMMLTVRGGKVKTS